MQLSPPAALGLALLAACVMTVCSDVTEAEGAEALANIMHTNFDENCTFSTMEDPENENPQPYPKMYIADGAKCNDWANQDWGTCNCPLPMACKSEGNTDDVTYYCQEDEPTDENQWFETGLVLGGPPIVAVGPRDADDSK